MHTPDMTTLGSQVLTGLQALALPLNIAALLAGALAGALLGTLFQRIGVSVAAALVALAIDAYAPARAVLYGS